jgi:hypothetical protein
MIFVERNQTIGGVDIRPKDAWFTQAQTLKDQAIQEGAAHIVGDHYKDLEVKAALEKLFHNKCAYCEGDPASEAPWDVEHYRPKGRVQENANHSGYYWLAYEWTNLLPSCVFCNQRRVDQPTFDEPIALPAAGKLDQFPLADETRRAMGPDDPLENEEPLLLNPCLDQDCESRFRYDILGEIFSADDADQRAVKTIEICNLKRRRLRDARRKEIVLMISFLKLYEQVMTSNNATTIALAQAALDAFLVDERPFAGTCRYINNNRHLFI